jgi:2-oxoacid:acceptor oxidoreductase gamma subunit (pyruvate/2-ketoisovalerate family)
MMSDDVIKIRWHGRGGQGAITAAKIVANAAFECGYNGVVMTPTFGTERRGAPVLTSLKISKNKIYDLSPIAEPDIIVVLDHLLLDEPGVTSGLKQGGTIIVNSPKTPADHAMNGKKIATADVTSISVEAGLKQGIVNSGIIGAFAKASGLMELDILLKKIEEEFRDKRPAQNAEAARLTFSRTDMGGLT